jgi:predicted NACHT family NTPase
MKQQAKLKSLHLYTQSSKAANPLLLSLIVMVYEVLQDLPEKRADLYKG